MPVVAAGAALAAAVGTASAAVAGTLIAGSILTTFAVNFGASMVLGLASKALSPKAKAPTVTLREDRTLMIRQPVVARRLIVGQARVSGPLVFIHSYNNNEYLHLVIALASNRLHSIGTVYFDDVPETDARFVGLVRVNRHLGAADQTADADLVAESGGKWTVEHRLRGIAYLSVRLKWSDQAWPGGLPSISCDVEGADELTDPRTGGTGYSRNAALAIRWYLRHPLGLGVGADEIDDSFFAAAANVSDEGVSRADGSAEPRYMVDGLIDTDRPPQQILQELLTACGGRLVYAGGKWRLLAGAWQSPGWTLAEGDVTGPIRIATRVSRREAFNGVKGVYVSPANHWQPSDYPAVASDAAMAEMGGERVWRDHPLPYTISSSAAQRLAKIELLRARQPLTVAVPATLAAMRCQAGDVIRVSNTRMGWAAKPFEVVEWTLAARAGADGVPVIGVDLMLRETDASVFDWLADEEWTVDPAPNSSLPGLVPTAPLSVTVTPSVKIQPDGTSVPALEVAWTVATDAFVGEWEVQWRPAGAAAWSSARASDHRHVIAPVDPGVNYQVRVRAVSSLGMRSAWAYASPADAAGDSEPPGPPTGLVATGGIRCIALTWRLPADRDLDLIEVWESATPRLEDAAPIATVRGTDFVRHGLGGLVTRYYWVRAIDRSGNVGDFNSNLGTGGTTVQLTHQDMVDRLIAESHLVPQLAEKIQGVEKVAEVMAQAAVRIQAGYDRIKQEVGRRESDVAEVTTRITQEVTDRQALAEQVTEVVAQYDASFARVTESLTALSAADGATATRIDGIVTNYDTSLAGIQETLTAHGDALTAQASRTDTIVAAYDRTLAAYEQRITASASGLEALTGTVTTLAATVGGNTAAIVSERNTRTSAVAALTTALDTVSVKVSGVTASLSEEITTRATKDDALSQSVTTLNTTVGQHTASIQTQAGTLNGLSAQYVVKVDVNGWVSGFGLASFPTTEGIVSEFVVKADRFIVGQPGKSADYPFVIGTVGGVARISMSSAFIQDASIVSATIAHAAIKNAHIGFAEIEDAHIKNLTIKGRSIEDLAAGNMAWGSGNNGASCAITTTGKPVALICSVQQDPFNVFASVRVVQPPAGTSILTNAHAGLAGRSGTFFIVAIELRK